MNIIKYAKYANIQVIAGVNLVWLQLWWIYLFTKWDWLLYFLSAAIGSSMVFNWAIMNGWIKC